MTMHQVGVAVVAQAQADKVAVQKDLDLDPNAAKNSKTTALTEQDVIDEAKDFLFDRYTGAFKENDQKAATKAGISLKEYVTNIDPKLAVNLMMAIKEMEKLGVLAPGQKVLNAGFRDDYRQGLITGGIHATVGNSWHGGSNVTQGKALAVDLQSQAANWVGLNGNKFGLAQPYGLKDVPHIALASSGEVQGRSSDGRKGGMSDTAVDKLYSSFVSEAVGNKDIQFASNDTSKTTPGSKDTANTNPSADSTASINTSGDTKTTDSPSKAATEKGFIEQGIAQAKTIVANTVDTVKSTAKTVWEGIKNIFDGGGSTNTVPAQPIHGGTDPRQHTPTSTPRSGQRPIEDIVGISVDFGINVGCADAQGVSGNGYTYTATLKSDTSANEVKEGEGCGLDTPQVYASEIAHDLEQHSNFAPIDINQILAKMTFTFHNDNGT